MSLFCSLLVFPPDFHGMLLQQTGFLQDNFASFTLVRTNDR